MKLRFFKSASLLMAILMFSLPLSSLAQKEIGSEIAGAIVAAERDAAKEAGTTIWFLGGLCLGPAVMVGALLSRPNPPPMALAGKSPAYVAAYVDAYQQKARSRKLKASGAGFLVSVGLYVLLVMNAN